MPRRPNGSQGGSDSRPVADAATSGDRRTICIDDPCPSPRLPAPVASRYAQPVRCAPTQHRDRAQNIQLRNAARPAPKGQGDTE